MGLLVTKLSVTFFASLRRYIEKTKLKGIKYKILEFNPMVLRGKVKPDSSRPDLLHPVSSGFTSVHAVMQTFCTDAAEVAAFKEVK